jgi:hypothetical protein
MAMNPAIGGLFISLNTPISKYPGIINFENLWSASELLVYLHSNDADLIINTVDMIISYAGKQMTAELDRENISSIIEEISDHNTRLAGANKIIYDLKNSLNREFDKLSHILSESEMNIRRLVRSAKVSLLPSIESEPAIIDEGELFSTPERRPGLLGKVRYQEIIVQLVAMIGGELKITVGRDIRYDLNLTLKVIPLKTKITIGVWVDTPMVIPLEANYNKNWVLFTFDKKNNPIPALIDFVRLVLELSN